MLGHYFLNTELSSGANNGLTMSDAWRSLDKVNQEKLDVSDDGNTYVWIKPRSGGSDMGIGVELFFKGYSNRKVIYLSWCNNSLGEHILSVNPNSIKLPIIYSADLNYFLYYIGSINQIGRKVLINNKEYTTIGILSRVKVNVNNPFVYTFPNLGRMACLQYASGYCKIGTVYKIEQSGSDTYCYYWDYIFSYVNPNSDGSDALTSITAVNEVTGSLEPAEGNLTVTSSKQYYGFVLNKPIDVNITNIKILKDQYYDFCRSLNSSHGVNQNWNSYFGYPAISSNTRYGYVTLDYNATIHGLQFKQGGDNQYLQYFILAKGNNLIDCCYMFSRGYATLITNNNVTIKNSSLLGCYNIYSGITYRSISLVNYGNLSVENSFIGYGNSDKFLSSLSGAENFCHCYNFGNLYLKSCETNIGQRAYFKIINATNGVCKITGTLFYDFNKINEEPTTYKKNIPTTRYENLSTEFTSIPYPIGGIYSMYYADNIVISSIIEPESSEKYRGENFQYLLTLKDYTEYKLLILEKIFYIDNLQNIIKFYVKPEKQMLNPFYCEIEYTDSNKHYENICLSIDPVQILENQWNECKITFDNTVIENKKNIRLKLYLYNPNINMYSNLRLSPYFKLEKD
jgi:hypothetical protein